MISEARAAGLITVDEKVSTALGARDQGFIAPNANGKMHEILKRVVASDRVCAEAALGWAEDRMAREPRAPAHLAAATVRSAKFPGKVPGSCAEQINHLAAARGAVAGSEIELLLFTKLGHNSPDFPALDGAMYDQYE